ncbi:MAG: response regulator transcription factor [Leptolyngbyaceae cyanobacterium SM1_1_3]|nr:response regulator transcription factor [Leptolyngbyaceae cyanobacterium SM1_1_3]
MCHVLIVEDEPKIAAFMQKGLSQAGYRAAVVNDGPTALAKVAADDYQLILLDLGLPGLDGYEVLRSLRSQGNACPVLIVTARQPITLDTTALQQLANGWVQKPFRMKDLISRIQHILLAQ